MFLSTKARNIIFLEFHPVDMGAAQDCQRDFRACNPSQADVLELLIQGCIQDGPKLLTSPILSIIIEFHVKRVFM